MHVYIETYGCAANQAHSEIMAGLLTRAGFILVQNVSLADVIIINSCAVKDPTEQRILHRIGEIHKKFPKKGLVIAGCMPQVESWLIMNIAPDAALVGPNNCTDIVKAVNSVLKGRAAEFLDDRLEEKTCLPRIRQNPLLAIIEIAQGCTGYCSYCLVRYAKGKLRSFSPAGIIQEIKLAKNTGCKEIWLTAQDTACYGQDIGTTLPKLLEKICKLPGKFRIRVGMLNPASTLPILDELIAAYKNDHVYKFLHIPVQSGSDNILGAMRRNYTVNDFKAIIKKFRSEIEGLTLWTDIIVGFPGEREEDFARTVELIKDIKPDFVNVSKFGARPRTEAAKLKPVPPNVIKERSKKLSELVDKLSLAKNEEWVGKKCLVLITEYKGNQWIGRNESYKKIVINRGRENLLGKFLTVKITDAKKTCLIGEVCSP